LNGGAWDVYDVRQNKPMEKWRYDKPPSPYPFGECGELAYQVPRNNNAYRQQQIRQQ